jgi:5-methylcytosine-specific restriction endonuclease McrA
VFGRIRIKRTPEQIDAHRAALAHQRELPSRRARRAKARAALLQRTPPWADLALIREFYAHAQRVTLESGLPHEVDHVIPLQGERVSGLHVETNLRVVPSSVNRAKSNRYEVDGGS